MDAIPTEVIHHIFSFVPFESWRDVRCVCKKWNDIASIVFDPSINNNTAIINASKRGCIEAVDYLLKHPNVQPNARGDLAIRNASMMGHTNVVKRLLQDPRVDPSVFGNTCLVHLSKRLQKRL